ncbi:MAG TPA: cyd operon YbgE family protein [Thiobacillus sp.]
MNDALNSGWARGVSLVSALALMVLVTILPRGLAAPDGSAIDHGILALIMWGMSAGFVHGVGFVPRDKILRVLLGPIAAWLGMGVGLVFYGQYFLR